MAAAPIVPAAPMPSPDPGTPTSSSCIQVLCEKIHKVSCRSVRFLGDGEQFVTCSLNKSLALVDTETGKVAHRLKQAHEAPINRLLGKRWSGGARAQPRMATSPALSCAVFNRFLLASGDDDGCIRLWDARQGPSAGHTHEFTAHSDFISDMTVHMRQREGLPDKELILAVSGDGTMTVNDMRKRQTIHQTETVGQDGRIWPAERQAPQRPSFRPALPQDNDDEYLSIQVVKGGRKVAVGSQSGVVNIFTWGAWNDCSDRFVGHPASVDTLVKLDEDTILSGSEDGIIRVLTVLPNKMVGVVGEHEDYPVERLALSSDCRCLASASHDSTVRLWNMRAFTEEEEEGDEEEEGVEEGDDGGG